MFSYKVELRDKNLRRIEAEYFEMGLNPEGRVDAYFYVKDTSKEPSVPVLVAFVSDPLTVRFDDHPVDTTSNAMDYSKEHTRPVKTTVMNGPAWGDLR